MNDSATDPDSPFGRGICLEGSHDFENDIDRSLSLYLLMMVEQEDRQILPHKESLEIVSLMNIRIDLIAKTKQALLSHL